MAGPLGDGLSTPDIILKDTGTYVFAEEALAPAAVEAVATQLRVVCRHAVPYLEADHLGTDSGHDANSLVAGDQRELGNKFAFVNVLHAPCQNVDAVPRALQGA